MNAKSQPIKKLAQLILWKEHIERNYPAKFFTFFVLGLNTGIAAKELRQLLWSDVLDGRRNIKNLVRKYETRHNYTIKLNLECKAVLLELRAQFPEDIYVFQSKTSKKGPIPLTATYVDLLLKKSAREAGLKETVAWATLRKTFGYHMVISGKWKLSELTIYFNQPSVNFTTEYCELPDSEDNVCSIPDNLFSNQTSG